MPGLHGLWSSEPVEHDEPAGQAVHWPAAPNPNSLLNEPSLHGSGAEAPSSQYEPGVHSKQAVRPLSFMNRPASHLAQLSCPPSGCTVPGLHSVGSTEPAEHNAPGGHA